MRPAPVRLARDAVDLLTGRRPEVRNRVKFFLLSPIYDGLGLDLSPEMLAVGRDKVTRLGLRNAPLVRADAGRLPFPAASFDAVTVSYGLHELPTDVRERALREVTPVLRRGGHLFAADLDRPPRFGWLVDLYLRLGEPAHARALVGDGLARLLRTAGFAVDREGPRGATPMQLLVARPSAR